MPRPKKKFSDKERQAIIAAWEQTGSVSGAAVRYAEIMGLDKSPTWDTTRRWLALLGLRKDSTGRNRKLAQRSTGPETRPDHSINKELIYDAFVQAVADKRCTEVSVARALATYIDACKDGNGGVAIYHEARDAIYTSLTNRFGETHANHIRAWAWSGRCWEMCIGCGDVVPERQVLCESCLGKLGKSRKDI